MGNKITCPVCKSINDRSESCCTECGQRLKAIDLDITSCPICKTINNKSAYCCISCGQRLRIAPSDGNKNNTSKFPLLLVLFISLGFLYFSYKYSDKVTSTKIQDFQEITITINQDEQFTLPEKVVAMMQNKKRKEVEVQWDNKIIDTSAPGTKMVSGKIKGYNKPVKLKAIVVPHKIINGFTNSTTKNSIVEVKTSLSEDTKQVWFKISKIGYKKDQVIAVEKGIVNAKLYLPFGSGKYNVSVYTSTEKEERSPFYQYGKFQITNEDTRDMTFLLPDTYVESDSPTIIELAYSITAGCHADMEKTRAIHDWVASNISYDTKAYFSKQLHEYSAIETLKGKTAVCNGYANLTAALNRAIGIKTKIVSGTATNSSKTEGHAWNETFIDGNWIIQDTTWDAGGINPKTQEFKFRLSHKYFNPKPEVFVKDHTKTEER